MDFAVVELGMRDADFWSITQYEFSRRVKRYLEKRDAEEIKQHNLAVLTAFLGIKMKNDWRRDGSINPADYFITAEKRFEKRDAEEPKRVMQLKAAVAYSAAVAG